MQQYPTVLEINQHNAWNTQSPELIELVGSQRTFFFGPNFFHLAA